MGIDAHLAGLLAYLLGFVSGLVIYLMEKEHREVRYHAAQSVIVSLAVSVAFVVLSIVFFVPLIGTLIMGVAWLAAIALWVYLLIQGYQLNHVKLPVAGDLAEQWADKQV